MQHSGAEQPPQPSRTGPPPSTADVDAAYESPSTWPSFTNTGSGLNVLLHPAHFDGPQLQSRVGATPQVQLNHPR